MLANTEGLTVIPTVKYLYSYLIAPLLGHKVVNTDPIRSFPKYRLTFETAPLFRRAKRWRHKRDNK
jgi:hypothetical protein